MIFRIKKGNTAFLLAVLLSTVSMAGALVVDNPYASVDWESIGHHKAALHNHTTQSDGAGTPDTLIDFYHSRGYTILAITDHNLCTYPWQDWGRDPAALGMLDIPGNEYSRHNHLNGFFICHETASTTVEQTLSEIDALGGIAHLNHPGRYWSLDGDGHIPETVLNKYVAWYTDFRQELLVGMEVFNKMNSHPHDMILWDALLTAMMPARPVWGFSSDDTHIIEVPPVFFADVSWNTFLLEELSENAVRSAMVNGRFYFSSTGTHSFPAVSNPDKTPVITSIIHDDQAGEISVSAVSEGLPLPEGDYRWVSQGEVVHVGPVLNYRTTPGIHRYVRAEMMGQGGTTYTNPFGFPLNGALTVQIDPMAAVHDGARWRLGGSTAWYEDGATVELVPGNYVVYFRSISGWEQPAPITVTILSDAATLLTAEEGAVYIEAPDKMLPVMTGWRLVLAMAILALFAYFLLNQRLIVTQAAGLFRRRQF